MLQDNVVKELLKAQERSIIARGFIDKIEIKEYANNNKKLLSLTLRCGKNRDRVDVTIFQTYKDPQKPVSIANEFKEGDFVYLKGSIQEDEYTGRDGKTRKNYRVITWNLFEESEEKKPGSANFNISGIIDKIRGKKADVKVTESYTNRNGHEVSHDYMLTIDLPDEILEEHDDLGKNDFVQIQGKLVNHSSLETEDIEGFDPEFGNVMGKKGKRRYEKKLEATFLHVIAEADQIEEVTDTAVDEKVQEDLEEIPF